MNCENFQGCNHCENCGGCWQSAALNPLEFEMLNVFSVTPFVPVAIDRQSGRMLLTDLELEPNAAGLALRMLQRRGLVRVDADLPLPNADYSGYEDWTRGSAALTARGQELLDDMEHQG